MIVIHGSPTPAGARDWDPDRHVSEVRRNLEIVFGTRVGQALRYHLWRCLDMRPRRAFDPNSPDAFAAPVDARAARPRGEPIRFSEDSMHTPDHDETGEPIGWFRPGTGQGTDVRICFTPSEYPDPSSPIPPGSRVPLYSDVTLAHELVHAVRMMWGVFSYHVFDPEHRRNWGFRHSEEYYAVLIENMYRSERGVPLRSTYDHPERLEFVANPQGARHPLVRLKREWIGRLEHEMPTMFNILERIPRVLCRYNPLSDFRAGTHPTVARIAPFTRQPPEYVSMGYILDPSQ